MTTPAPRPRVIFETHLASKQPYTRETYLRSLQRLEAWAENQGLDTKHLKTADLERFLADEGRQYARGSIKVRLAALRAFYQCLHSRGLINDDPTRRLGRIPTDHRPSSQPVAYLDENDLAQLRAHAETLGSEPSLAICLLHETPISIAGIARLSVDDLAESPSQQTFVLLGNTPASKTPWPISDQARRAIDALRSDHPRLMLLTKNPNLLKVRSVLGQTRAYAKIETPDIAAALKGTQRREERELCEQLRLQPRRLVEYRRRLLAELKPLGSSVT
jgi:site-specific recombinase XerD